MRSRGVYINLDRSADRREQMEAAIAELAFPYAIERFPAMVGDGRKAGLSQGELGCFLSHQAVVDQAADDEIALIFEDDVYFPNDFTSRYLGIIRRLAGMDWDMVFLGQVLDYNEISSVHGFLKFKRALGDINAPGYNDFRILPGEKVYRWGGFAYAVNPRALPRLRALLQRVANEGYRAPIDTVYRMFAKERLMNTKVVFPYIVGVQYGLASTAVGRVGSNMSLHNTLTNLFVAGCDQGDARAEAARYLAASPADDDALVVSRILYERLRQT